MSLLRAVFALRATFALALVGLLFSSAVLTPAQKNSSRTQDAARHASDAAKTFTEIMNVPDKAILAGDTGTGTVSIDSSISPTSLEILANGHTGVEQRRERNLRAKGR